MREKIIYKKDALLGNNPRHSSAMRDIAARDQESHVVNQYQEKKQLFDELKKYRDGGVTDTELKSVLANLKYNNKDYFSREEVNKLSEGFGVGKIERKHLPPRSFSHTSHIDRAHHDANFVQNGSSFKTNGGYAPRRTLPSDNILRNKK